MIAFKIGAAYSAVPALEGARRRMIVVIGRDEDAGRIQFVWAEDLSIEKVETFDLGREVLRTERPDGVYMVSSACEVDAANAATVLEMLNQKLDRELEGGRIC